MSRRIESETRRRETWLICAVLLLATLAIYWPSLKNDFVNYDDPQYVTSNPHLKGGLSWANVRWAFTTGYASNWHPLTWISHIVDYEFYGLELWGHHLTNLLWHAANVLLLFWLLREMTGAMWRSAFVAALFAWHPAHVESVAWISERKDLLSTFFAFLTLLMWVKFKVRGSKFNVYYVLALLCFTCGLMCKPMLVTLPFVMLLLDWWSAERLSAECGVRSAELGKSKSSSRVDWRMLVLEKVPFFLMALVSCVVTFEVQRAGGAVSSLNTLSVGRRMANTLVSYCRYIGEIFWPRNLSVLYPYPGSWPAGAVVGAAIFLIAVSVWVVRERVKRPYLAVGWFWFLGMLVPVIGLVQVGVQSMADRYTYVPAIGLFIMVAWGAAELAGRRPQWKLFLETSAAVALAACLAVTFIQAQYWKNGETLFRRAVKVTRNNYLAYNNLGFFLENRGAVDEAMEDYEKSIEIDPNYEEAQNNIGHALAAKKRYSEAIPYFETALRIKPGLVEAHNNLGNALSNTGKLDEAIAHYEAALHYKPDDEDAHNNLGIARAMQGRLGEAEQLLREAVLLNPDDAGAHSNLGNVLAAQHKLEEASAEYQICLRLNPANAQARNNLGNVLTEQGKLEDAKENYLTALKLNSENPEANYNLGLILLRMGNVDDARKCFAEALRIRPDYKEAQQQLAALGGMGKH